MGKTLIKKQNSEKTEVGGNNCWDLLRSIVWETAKKYLYNAGVFGGGIILSRKIRSH